MTQNEFKKEIVGILRAIDRIIELMETRRTGGVDRTGCKKGLWDSGDDGELVHTRLEVSRKLSMLEEKLGIRS